MEKNELLLEGRQEEIRRKELELTRKCDEELAKQNRINAARAELEIKHFEEKQGERSILSSANVTAKLFSHKSIWHSQICSHEENAF